MWWPDTFWVLAKGPGGGHRRVQKGECSLTTCSPECADIIVPLYNDCNDIVAPIMADVRVPRAARQRRLRSTAAQQDRDTMLAASKPKGRGEEDEGGKAGAEAGATTKRT